MSQYYATINSTERIQLFNWDASSFHSNQQLFIASDDLPYIRNVFTAIQTISIANEQDIEVATFTEFDGFSSISYMGRNYSSQLGGFANELIVTLTKVDLVEQVQRIDEKVNPVIDFDAMTLEEYKAWKINQLSSMGEQTIFRGTDVELTDGTIKNFTYDLEDQSNLLNAMFIIQALDDLTITIPYHGHGEPCELYGALDILAVYIALQVFSTTVQTLVNMKINWVRTCQTKDEVSAITYETPLPEEWMNRANAILVPAMEIVNELKRKYFPEDEEDEPVDGSENEPGAETEDETEGAQSESELEQEPEQESEENINE